MEGILAGTVALRLLLAAGLTLALILVLVALRFLFTRATQRVDDRLLHSPWALAIQDMELMSAANLRRGLCFLLGAAHMFAALFAVYLYIPFMLGLFPGTEPLALPLAQYFVTPLTQLWQALVDYLPSLVSMLVILFYAWLILKLLYVVKVALQKRYLTLPDFRPEWSEPTYKILRFLVLALTLAMVVPLLPGADSPAFKGVSLFVGAMVTLGSTTAMGNITSGIVLIYTRAFNVGDMVRVGEAFGEVVERSLVATRIKTPKHEIVTIPNSSVLSSQVTNYSDRSESPAHLVHVQVSIGYDVDWRTVHHLMVAAAQDTALIDPVPEPFVLQKGMGDFSVSYEINAYTRASVQLPQIYSELMQHVLDRFAQTDIEILSPAYTAIRDGNPRTTPST